ncbi:RAMP superfamily CRISPR-associated protein [Campylobacter canadensis]|uniref:CRISPR type III-associated protein domain-containing protein n=1 Tax=Campylobacter canadensis TaxID=449520 RepID=A0ABS7WSM6_9BACT|nr:RAMP superfamily CRISPR-associated protein [Campylobacter canadensis]MBZ7987775.1 hypothetical protein [Campylobacter canadensis]MBZ7998572.1 hypothetical protein [Campylobacter canadensis]
MILRITLSSNAIITNGNGDALIDLDSDYNEYGLPYISAKRLKGMLKDSANELISMGQDINVSKLFGDENEEGIIKLSDANLKESLILEKLSSEFKTDIIKNSFSVILNQTSLDEFGVAKAGSLRRFRAYDKGLVFESEIEGNLEFQKDLELICLNLRYIGHKRTRGFGKVKCELIEGKNTEQKNGKSPNENDKMMIFTLLDDVIFTSLSGDENTVDTKGYLSASAIKGAFKKLGIEYSKPQNAYFYDGKNIFYPAPMNLKRYKYPDDETLEKNTNILKKLIVFNEKTEKSNDEKKSSIGGYICIENGVLNKAKISTINKTHVSLADKENMSLKELEKHKDDKEYKNKIFSYTALSKGQKFAIKLMYDEDFSKLDGKVLRLGKSANSQYGRVKISFESSNDKEVNFNGEFYLVAISPVLLRNEIGGFEPSFDALKSALKDIEECDLELKEIIISRYEKAQFYNNSYKCKTPQVMGFSIGSVFKVSGKLNDEFCMVGAQQEFGFGRLKAYASFNDLKLEKDQETKQTNEISSDELKIIEPALKNILKQDLEQRVFLSNEYKNYVIQDENYKKHGEIFSASELSRMQSIASTFETNKDFKTQFEDKYKDSAFYKKMQDKGLRLDKFDVAKHENEKYKSFYTDDIKNEIAKKVLISKIKYARKMLKKDEK